MMKTKTERKRPGGKRRRDYSGELSRRARRTSDATEQAHIAAPGSSARYLRATYCRRLLYTGNNRLESRAPTRWCSSAATGKDSLTVSRDLCRVVDIGLTTMFLLCFSVFVYRDLSGDIRRPAGNPHTVHHLTSSTHVVFRLPGERFPSNYLPQSSPSPQFFSPNTHI